MEGSLLNRIMSVAFLFLGLTILFWILGMMFNMTMMMTLFMVCGFVAVILIIISAIFIWRETEEG